MPSAPNDANIHISGDQVHGDKIGRDKITYSIDPFHQRALTAAEEADITAGGSFTA